MTELEVLGLGYINDILHDPYQFRHPSAPSIYQTNTDSGTWYFYYQGREIYINRQELTQIISIFSK